MSCSRLFQYAVLREADYRAYLRDVVDVIDHAAQAAGAFETAQAVTAPPDADWTQGRLFTFRDADQRAGFADAMAQASLRFDGGEAARLARKAHAETLRRLVRIVDA